MSKVSERTKRMVTDPTTGERTAMTTTNKEGRVEWIHTKEWNDDVERAQSKNQTWQAFRAFLRRAIS
mgnify:CR=1 FL=1